MNVEPGTDIILELSPTRSIQVNHVTNVSIFKYDKKQLTIPHARHSQDFVALYELDGYVYLHYAYEHPMRAKLSDLLEY